MTGLIKYTDNFIISLYEILKDYSSKNLNLLLSGGSLLSLFNNIIFKKIDSSRWQIYFSDERLNGETNIESARLNFKYMSATLNDLREKKLQKCELAILSVGEDGHVASLFPNHLALCDLNDFCYVYDSPKEPKERITVTIKYLNEIEKLIFMIPPKNGIVKEINGPHTSITEKLKNDFVVYLDKSLQ
ncbi:hypothetical protein GVAV_002136 [Gurleya vavrai]